MSDAAYDVYTSTNWTIPPPPPPSHHERNRIMRSDKRIHIMPDPILEMASKPITKEALGSAELIWLMQTMVDVCRKVDAAGLAAPQIGVPVRLVVVNYQLTTPMFFFNPVVEPVGETKKVYNELCFSSPGIELKVERHGLVHVHWMDLDGKDQDKRFGGGDGNTISDKIGWVLQHETDHLDGLCLYQRLTEGQQADYRRRTNRQREKSAKWRARRKPVVVSKPTTPEPAPLEPSRPALDVSRIDVPANLDRFTTSLQGLDLDKHEAKVRRRMRDASYRITAEQAGVLLQHVDTAQHSEDSPVNAWMEAVVGSSHPRHHGYVKTLLERRASA